MIVEELASRMAKNLHFCVGLALKEVLKGIFRIISKKKRHLHRVGKRGTQSYAEKGGL